MYFLKVGNLERRSANPLSFPLLYPILRKGMNVINSIPQRWRRGGPACALVIMEAATEESAEMGTAASAQEDATQDEVQLDAAA